MNEELVIVQAERKILDITVRYEVPMWMEYRIDANKNVFIPLQRVE